MNDPPPPKKSLTKPEKPLRKLCAQNANFKTCRHSLLRQNCFLFGLRYENQEVNITGPGKTTRACEIYKDFQLSKRVMDMTPFTHPQLKGKMADNYWTESRSMAASQQQLSCKESWDTINLEPSGS